MILPAHPSCSAVAPPPKRVAGWCVLLVCAGCRLPCYDGPSAKNVIASRQLTQRAMREMERGKWVDAERSLADAVKQCPSDHDAHRLYAETLWTAGRQREALVEMSEAMRLAEDDEQVLVRYAEMRLARSEHEQALDAVQRALDLNPQSADAWTARGKLCRATGELRQAVADFHHALACDPNRRDALLGLAEVYRQQNEPQRALANLRALADTYAPAEAPREVLELEAQAILALGRSNDAAEKFEAACRGGPPELRLWLATADCQLRAGQRQAAQATLEQALALWPASPEVQRRAVGMPVRAPTLLTSRP